MRPMRHFHDHQGIPKVKQQAPRRKCGGSQQAGDHQGGGQVEKDHHTLQQERVPAGQGGQGKNNLGRGQVGAGHPGVVDESPLGNGQEIKKRIVHGERVRIESIEGQMPIPDVTVDIVGKGGGRQQEQYARAHGRAPDPDRGP